MGRRRRAGRPSEKPSWRAEPRRGGQPPFPGEGDRRKAEKCVTNGVNCQRRERHNEAIAFYDKAIKADPTCISAHSNKGAALLITGRPAEALAPLERAVGLVATADPDKDHVLAYTNLAGVLDMLGRRSEAVGRLNMALDYLNRNGPGDHKLEMVAHMFETLGENVKAAACRRGISPAWKLHIEGVRLANEGRDEEAAACFGRAVREDPSLAEAHYSRGTMMRHLGRFDDALDCFRQAAKADPDFVIAYSDIAAELNRMGRDDEAMESVEEALRRDPDLGVAAFGKGVILASTKQHRGAVAWFGRAAESDPYDAIIHINKGMSHMALGENLDALGCFNRALELDPRDGDARRGKLEAEQALGMRHSRSWWDKMRGRR